MNNQPYHTDRVNEYPDIVLNAVETSEADIPITPLPNPGKGGPVDSSNGTDNSDIPVTPLPDPGEGGPVNNGNRSLPPTFRPIFPGGTGGSVTMIPGITFPCSSCMATNFDRVRFLNVPTGYQPSHVYLGNRMVVSGLASGDTTSYVQSASGIRTVTISGANGYVYTQKSIRVNASSSMTIIIINTANGLDITETSDISCNAPSGDSCLCACNLSQNLGPFDVPVGNQNNPYTAFIDVRHQEVAPYTSFYLGWYQFYIAGAGAFPSIHVTTATANMSTNMSYILYTFNTSSAIEGLRTMVVPNQRGKRTGYD